MANHTQPIGQPGIQIALPNVPPIHPPVSTDNAKAWGRARSAHADALARLDTARWLESDRQITWASEQSPEAEAKYLRARTLVSNALDKVYETAEVEAAEFEAYRRSAGQLGACIAEGCTSDAEPYEALCLTHIQVKDDDTAEYSYAVDQQWTR